MQKQMNTAGQQVDVDADKDFNLGLCANCLANKRTTRYAVTIVRGTAICRVCVEAHNPEKRTPEENKPMPKPEERDPANPLGDYLKDLQKGE